MVRMFGQPIEGANTRGNNYGSTDDRSNSTWDLFTQETQRVLWTGRSSPWQLRRAATSASMSPMATFWSQKHSFVLITTSFCNDRYIVVYRSWRIYNDVLLTRRINVILASEEHHFNYVGLEITVICAHARGMTRLSQPVSVVQQWRIAWTRQANW